MLWFNMIFFYNFIIEIKFGWKIRVGDALRYILLHDKWVISLKDEIKFYTNKKTLETKDGTRSLEIKLSKQS